MRLIRPEWIKVEVQDDSHLIDQIWGDTGGIKGTNTVQVPAQVEVGEQALTDQNNQVVSVFDGKIIVANPELWTPRIGDHVVQYNGKDVDWWIERIATSGPGRYTIAYYKDRSLREG